MQKYLSESKQNNFPFFSNKKKVDFIICGTQKGGTSALDAYLREHPQICMAKNKEVHFFDNEEVFKNSKVDYSLYHAAFNPLPHHKVVGEATPIYMYWYDAPRRMYEYNPHLKLIVILRNPIERAFSHWNMERSRNAETLSFWEAIINENERCREALPYQHRVYSYVDRGFYLEQLRRLWTFFPVEQVLILRNEELRNSFRLTLNKVFRFLGVELMQDIKFKNVHSTPYISQMSDEEKEYLKFIYEYEIRGLERVLNWDCSNWLT